MSTVKKGKKLARMLGITILGQPGGKLEREELGYKQAWLNVNQQRPLHKLVDCFGETCSLILRSH